MRRYAGDPTIAFWQLVNEAEDLTSEHGSCPTGAADVLRAFADDMVSVVHSADRNHLVSLGTMGGGQCGSSGSAAYRLLHSGSVDICEYHDYDPAHAIAWPSDPWNGMQVRLDDCRALGKPMVIGEAGICAEVQSDGSCGSGVTAASLRQRAAFFQAKTNAAFSQGVAGYLIWSRGETTSVGFDVGPGDPTEAVMLATSRRLSTS